MTKNFCLIFPEDAILIKQHLISSMPEWVKETKEEITLFTDEDVENFSLVANVEPNNYEDCVRLFTKIADEFKCEFFTGRWVHSKEDLMQIEAGTFKNPINFDDSDQPRKFKLITEGNNMSDGPF